MSFLAAYLHTLDGKLFTIYGDIAVRFYGLTYVAGFIIAWCILHRLAKKGMIFIPAHRVPDAMLAVVVGTLLGGRVIYAIFYGPELIGWKFFRVWEGGMASHGGILGIVIGCWFVARGFREPDGTRIGKTRMLHITDCMVLVGPFGLMLGRIANFVNGELLGKIVTPPGTPGPWWTVQFPQELAGRQPDGSVLGDHHSAALTPAQLDSYFVLMQDVMSSLNRPELPFKERWSQASDYLLAHADRYRDRLEPLLSSRHPSQIYQALAEGLFAIVFVWALWAKPRKVGLLTAWWLMFYGVMRILTEIWRLPDAQFGDAGRIFYLSRGQWLSAVMIPIGAGLLVYALRCKGDKVGGWLWPGAKGDGMLKA